MNTNWTPVAGGGVILLPRPRNPLGKEAEHVHTRREKREAKKSIAALRKRLAAFIEQEEREGKES